MKQILLSSIVSAVVAGIISAGGLWYYHHRYALRLAVIDIADYADRLEDGYINRTLTEPMLEQRLMDLNRRLKTDYAHTIVLHKEAVISGTLQEIVPSK